MIWVKFILEEKERKRLLALLLVLAMCLSMATYTVWAADEEEEELEDILTDEQLEELNQGDAPEGFDQNAVQSERDEHRESAIADGEYRETDLTIDDIKNMFGPNLEGVAAADPIRIFINGIRVIFPDTQPQIIDGRTLVPARIVAEQLGATVDWNEAEQKVTITKDALTLVLTIDNNTVYVNGVAQTLDVPAMVISDRTMVPFRFIFEAFNMRVEWSEQNVNGVTVSMIETFSN